MIDIKKILTRAWHILWTYRVLWIFGFLIALGTGAGSFGGSSNYSFDGNRSNQPSTGQPDEAWETIKGDSFAEVVDNVVMVVTDGIRMFQEDHPVEFRMIIGAVITGFVVALVFGTLITVLRYVGETAAIRLVDEYEESEVRVGFRQAWRYGWSRQAWRLFLVNFVIHLPTFVLFIVLALVGWWIFSALMSGVEWTIISSLIAGIGLAFLAIFLTVILMVVLYVIRDLAWRMVALEGMGVRESLRAGAGLLRKQWRSVGLTWLVMIGVRIAWGIVFVILVFPLLALSIFTAVAGVATMLVPALLTAGIAGLLSAPEYWPWIFALIVGAPFFAIVTFSPILLVGGWWEIYRSSVWTLTYRELLALDTMAENGDADFTETGNAELPGPAEAAEPGS